MSNERSPGGSAIYRHDVPAAPSLLVEHADDTRISDHLHGVHSGRGFVWHELVSDRVHLDIHVLAPTDDHPFYLVATSGMSARPMAVPPGMKDAASWQYAELCMLLPPSWTPGQEEFKDERMYWPIRLLKNLARIPHDFSTWLGWGHSIPNGDPAKPYAPGSALCGAILVPPFVLGKELFVVPGEPPMHLFQVLPVTAKEMQLKLELGIDALLERLEEHIPDIFGPVDAARPGL